MNTLEFIERANQIHCNKYDYSLVNYVNTHTKITIICHIHGAFEQLPTTHLHKKSGCYHCSVNERTYTTQEFIAEANKVHNNKYSYPDEYINAATKIRIICPIHGEFFQTPDRHIHGKNNCPTCSIDGKKSTHDGFVTKANLIHDNKYGYIEPYQGNNLKIKILCNVHGIFEKTPQDHLYHKRGCPKCSSKKLSTSEFIDKANSIHNNKYQYPDEYVNSKTKIRIICPVHGEFFQTPEKHLNIKSNCPSCKNVGHSKLAVEWLNSIMERDSIFIQHAQNGGEYLIPNTRYKADGYCQLTNTIYEFHGDCFHGNPTKFKPTDNCNYYSTLTAKELYDKTELKEQRIRELGYNLITIWESDYLKQKKGA